MHWKDYGMDLRLWATLVLMTILMVAAKAARLYPCDGGYRDVIENTAGTFHCDQYSGPVEWRYKGPLSGSFYPISMCNETHCTASFDPTFTPAYISAGNTSLTTTLTSRDVSVAGGEYMCDNNRCRMHIIVPASVSKPTSFITRTDQGYYLHCQTRITKVYSSKGQYSCEWQNGTTQVKGKLNLQPPPDNTTDTLDRMGTCNVTLQLSNPSDAICSVTVSPGNTVASSVIALMRPSQPEISCLTCPGQANSTVTCTCSTDNLGQPGGRLVWYAGTNDVFDRELVRGSFDVNSLTMTRTLNRSDHNITMFRCVNEWITNVNASTDFTATVNWNDNSTSTRRRRKRNAVSTSSPCFGLSDSTNAETPEDSPSIVIIIVGSIGGGAGLTGVVVVVVVVIKRRKKGAQKAACNHHQGGNRTAVDEDPDYDIEIVNVCYESSESTFGQVPGSHYEYIDTRLSMNPTLQVAAYAQSSKYTAKENITDEYACVRRDR